MGTDTLNPEAAEAGTSYSSTSHHHSGDASGSSTGSDSASGSRGQEQDIGGRTGRAGIIPRAIGQIFDEITKKSNLDGAEWKFETRNSYVEIYSELKTRLGYTLVVGSK